MRNGYAIKTHKPAEEPETVTIERMDAVEVVLLSRRVLELASKWTTDQKVAMAARFRERAKEILDAAQYLERLTPEDHVPEFLRAGNDTPLFARKQAGQP